MGSARMYTCVTVSVEAGSQPSVSLFTCCLLETNRASSQCPKKEHMNKLRATWQGNAFCKKRCVRTQTRLKAQQAKMAPAFHSCHRWWLCLIPLVEDQLYNLMKLAKQHKEEWAVQEIEVLTLISKSKQNKTAYLPLVEKITEDVSHTATLNFLKKL